MILVIKKLLKKELFWFLLLGIVAFLLFKPGFSYFFHQDDFIHASFSQNLPQVVKAFNIFSKADYPFYRPLSTQTYFFIGLKLFGNNPLPFHIINFSILLLNAYLIYKLGKILFNNRYASFLASIFYTLNATHISPMFSSAYVQELLLTTFFILSATFFIRFHNENRISLLVKSIIFFILALMSKETAIVVPALSFLAVFLFKKVHLKKLVISIAPFVFVSAVYAAGHFFFYGLPQSSSYVPEFGKSTINILGWYFLWSLSVPAMLIDFVGHGGVINPTLWIVGKPNIQLFFALFPIFILLNFVLVFLFKEKRKLIIFAVWFVVGVLPVLPFPKHHLAIEQTLSLVGLSLGLGIIFNNFLSKKRMFGVLGVLGILAYITLAFNGVNLATRTHYAANGSKVVVRTISYLKNLPVKINNETILYFRDGKILVPAYGSSKQISLALGGDRAIKQLFDLPNIRVYFEEGKLLPESLLNDKNLVEINSSELFYGKN